MYYMSTVCELAFALPALSSKMIGILIKCVSNRLYEINSLCNEHYLLFEKT